MGADAMLALLLGIMSQKTQCMVDEACEENSHRLCDATIHQVAGCPGACIGGALLVSAQVSSRFSVRETRMRETSAYSSEMHACTTWSPKSGDILESSPISMQVDCNKLWFQERELFRHVPARMRCLLYRGGSAGCRHNRANIRASVQPGVPFQTSPGMEYSKQVHCDNTYCTSV
jgi:hypothetical protein